MNHSTGRRRFLQVASATPFLAMPIARPARAGTKEPSETVVVGIMGMGGRGSDHLRTFTSLPGVEVAYLCDVDQRRSGKAAADACLKGKKTPKSVGDFR